MATGTSRPLSRLLLPLFVGVVSVLVAESACPRGWLTVGSGRSATCMKLYSSTRKNFNAAQAFCQTQGGYLARDTSATVHNKIKPYIRNAKNSRTHPSSFWIGLTDNNKNGGPWAWIKGPNLGSFHYWISNPRNTVNKQDCFYVLPAESQLKWHVTNNCLVNRAVICQRDFNPPAVRTTPAPRVTCPRGWTPYKTNPTCVRLYTQGKTWDDARAYCKANGGDLVKINDGRMNGFINGMVTRARGVYWIGLHDRHRENKFEWLDEDTTTKFAYWIPHEPNNSGGNENCVSILGTRNNRWNDANCVSRYRFICQRAATVNGQAPPPTTHMPVSRNCGAGWEDDPNTAYCFQFNTDLLSWLDARAYCQSAGGDLASIGSVQEQFYVSGRTVAFDASFFWIGANDRATERGWQWTDKKPMSFLNWDNGQPNNQHNSDCVGMVKKTGRWDDLPCQSRYASVCKKVGRVTPRTPRPTTSPARLPNGQVWGCPVGWKKYRGSCYQVLRSPSGLDWNTAKAVCSARLSSLVTITDDSENKFVFSLIPRQYRSSAWIGLNDLSKENSYAWADGTTITYTNWYTGEPNNSGNEDCVLMLYNSGRWNDGRCSSKMKLMVCKQNAAAHSKAEFALKEGCDQGGVGYGAQCYSYIYAPRGFSAAQQACKAKKGNLATVDNRHVQAFVAAEMYHLPGEAYWIGLSSTAATQNAYAWSSGLTTVDYTNWDMTHTGKESNTCVGMRVARPAGLWVNYPCNKALPYICETPRKGFTTPVPTTTTTSRLPCSPGWWAWGNMCFKSFTPVNNTLPWNDARDYCANLATGGTLATLRNKNFQTWLRGKIMQNTKSPGRSYWIGLSDKDTEGGYKWLDGFPYIYTKWGPNEPNDYQKREDCAEWILSPDYWNDNYCYLTNNYICQVPRGVMVTTPKPTPTIGMAGGPCGNASWTEYNNYCYFISPEDGDMALSSWFEARLTCLDMGGELASISGEDENGYLTTLMSLHPVFAFWIGLNDLDQDTYKWTDRTPLYYVSWNKNEPNDALGGERCGEITSRGLWNDLNCQEQRGYICKKRPGDFKPSYTSTAIPKGGCPPNFHTNPTVGRCYYVGGTTKDTAKNYTDAITACDSVMRSSRLASIHSSMDEKFVVTLLAGLQWPAWIGFNDQRRRNRFEWIDNLNVDYVHWGWKQPDENLKDSRPGARRDCVDIEVNPKYAGNWNDKKCSNKYAYVCEYKKDTYYQAESPNTFGCSQGYQRFRDSCYKYVDQTYTWSQAEGLCGSEGGHLASLVDKYETAFAELLLPSKASTQLWIGLSYSLTTYSYQWSDGWPVEYTHWGKGEPDRDQGEGCVSHTSDGFWQDVPCKMMLPYICEINLSTPPAPTGPVYGTCPDNTWQTNGEYCYLLESKNTKSWPGANYACQIMGAALVSIHTDAESRFLTQMITRPQLDTWIGMSKGSVSGFGWSDRSQTEYLNWAQGEPNDPDSNMHQDCVKAQAADGTWADTDCFDSNAYVCKIRQKTIGPTQGPVPGNVVTIPGGGNPNLYTPYNPFNPQTPYNPGNPNTPYNPGNPNTPYNPWNPNPVVTNRQGVYTDNPFNKPGGAPVINNGGSHMGFSQGDSSDSGTSVSGGAVVGIILGAIAIIAIAATVAFVMRRYFITKAAIPAGTGGFDNATYHSSTVGDKVALSASDA